MIFGKKKKIIGSNDQQYICRKKGEAINLKSTIPTVKHGGRRIMLLGVFRWKRTSGLNLKSMPK